MLNYCTIFIFCAKNVILTVSYQQWIKIGIIFKSLCNNMLQKQPTLITLRLLYPYNKNRHYLCSLIMVCTDSCSVSTDFKKISIKMLNDFVQIERLTGLFKTFTVVRYKMSVGHKRNVI
jgi:hypothetical protein